MKKKIITCVGILLLISCQPKEMKQPQEEFLKIHIENWKKQLLINGEIGAPCQENMDHWSAQNPERYYGLPTTAIQVDIFDSNNDNIKDILLHFPAGDCCSCSVGMNEGSDFVKLIYSNGNELLDNDNLREKIASKIELAYYEKTNHDVERAIFSITGFTHEISGTFQLWTMEDPDCCASVVGTFSYNPFTFMIDITHQKAS